MIAISELIEQLKSDSGSSSDEYMCGWVDALNALEGLVSRNDRRLIPRGYSLVYGKHVTEDFSFFGREFKKGDVFLHLRPDKPSSHD
ncbi:MAG: hypothetical protein KatS3mg087_2201 [Patescibacteria group bacterium]|nr:MAG: hypothetical protein KatS3mg087_2201 [Patescibacteria group bacterium]